MIIDDHQRLLVTLWAGLRELDYTVTLNYSIAFPQIIQQLTAQRQSPNVRVHVDAADLAVAPAVVVKAKIGKHAYHEVARTTLVLPKDVTGLLHDLKAVASPTHGRDSLPEPLEFATAPASYDPKTKVTKAHTQINAALTYGIVTIGGDGFVTSTNLNDPATKPWFIVGCSNHYRGRFYVITDGDRYYQVHELNDQMRKLRSPIRTKVRSTSPYMLGPLDQQVLQEAISHWVKDNVR